MTASPFSTPNRAGLLIGVLMLGFFYGIAHFSGSTYLTERVWDEGHYQGIVEHGYHMRMDDFTEYQNLCFSPGSPLLHRLMMGLTGLEYPYVRLILGAICFLFTCVGLSRVLQLFSSNAVRNHVTLLLFCLWPGALYFMTGYAESLYMALVAWFFYHLLKKNFLTAALLACFALFTRSPAIILAPTLAIAVFSDALRTRTLWPAVGRTVLLCALYMPLIALGLVLYMGILYLEVGDPFGFHKAYTAWIPYVHEGVDNLLWQTLLPVLGNYDNLPFVTKAGFYHFLLVPLIVFPMRNRIPVELLAFTVIGWAFLLHQNRHHEPFIDMLRWSAVLFPVPYCAVLWIQDLRGLVSALLARRAALRQPVGRVLEFGAYAVLAVGIGALYVNGVSRFCHNMWVS